MVGFVVILLWGSISLARFLNEQTERELEIRRPTAERIEPKRKGGR